MATPSDVEWTVRSLIYDRFAKRGSAPTIGQLAGAVNASDERVRTALACLHEAHEVALSGDRSIGMAHPFSALPTDFRVDTPQMTCFANCAWDALGVPAILGTDGWTCTHCAETGDPMEFGVRQGQLLGDDAVIHLVVPPRAAWDDITFT